MRPPKGFENEKNPLLHRLKYKFGLGLTGDTQNSALCPIVMSSKDAAGSALIVPDQIKVNPHNSGFAIDGGPLVQQMSIIDRMTISIKFNMTHYCDNKMWSAGNSNTAPVFVGDSIPSLHFLFRPIFNVFPEKLDAADDDTTTTVAAILGLTKDATNEDVVPVTTNDLPAAGPSELAQPMSTVNGPQVYTDFNMTTDTKMEDHVFDENLLHDALRRYTNKGALRSCLGRTRHVTLSKTRPYANFYIDKFVPRAIRRIQPYAFFAMQFHLYKDSDLEQTFFTKSMTASVAHIGVSMNVNYHEWNQEYDQDRGVPA